MEKISFTEAKKFIKNVNLELYTILEKINPEDSYHIYFAEYDYGVELSDDEKFYFPHHQKLLGFDELPKCIQKDFSLWNPNIPFGIILEKNMEHYIRMPNRTIPGRIYTPGDCFGYEFKLHDLNYKITIPIYYVTIGARSCFCITNLGNELLFSSLKKKLNKYITAPKTPYAHQPFFKILYENLINKKTWKLKLLYFSDKWMKAIKTNPDFIELSLYLFRQYWMKGEILRERISHDYLTSNIFSKLENFRPEPYITEIIRSFVLLLTNACFGYAPQIDDSYLPLNEIQNILLHEYKVPHSPIIFCPSLIKDTNILYYSLNYPSSAVFSRVYSTQQSMIKILDEVTRFSAAFFKKISKSLRQSNSLFEKMVNNTKIQCFHTHTDKYHSALTIDKLNSFDSCIAKRKDGLDLPNSGPFLRGLIGLKTL